MIKINAAQRLSAVAVTAAPYAGSTVKDLMSWLKKSVPNLKFKAQLLKGVGDPEPNARYATPTREESEKLAQDLIANGWKGEGRRMNFTKKSVIVYQPKTGGKVLPYVVMEKLNKTDDYCIIKIGSATGPSDLKKQLSY
jgi:hypothetical protein